MKEGCLRTTLLNKDFCEPHELQRYNSMTEIIPLSESGKPPIFTQWEPRPGWLILLPSRTAPKKGDLILPDSHTKKSNSGVCIKCGTDLDKELFYNKECFFPTHSEYPIHDSDTAFLIYVVEVTNIILIRTPPPDVMRFSREKGEGLTFETITHDQRREN